MLWAPGHAAGAIVVVIPNLRGRQEAPVILQQYSITGIVAETYNIGYLGALVTIMLQ